MLTCLHAHMLTRFHEYMFSYICVHLWTSPCFYFRPHVVWHKPSTNPCCSTQILILHISSCPLRQVRVANQNTFHNYMTIHCSMLTIRDMFDSRFSIIARDCFRKIHRFSYCENHFVCVCSSEWQQANQKFFCEHTDNRHIKVS